MGREEQQFESSDNNFRDHVISSKVYPCGIELTVLGSDHFSSWHLEVGSRKGK